MFRVTNVTLRGFQGFQGSHVILPSQVLLWDLFAVLQPPRGPGTKWTCGAFVGQVPVGNGPFSYQNISKPNGLYLDRPTNQTHRGIILASECPSCKIYVKNYMCCHGAPCPRWVYAHSQYGFQWMVRQGWWCILDAFTGLDMCKKAILSILSH